MSSSNTRQWHPAPTRRDILKVAGAGASLVAFAGSPLRAFAADPIKVAAIYTVPVEQQWVSRIHKAANAAKDRGDIEYVFSENVSNTDYERVMREYAEAGQQADHRRGLRRRGRGPRGRRRLSRCRLPDGLELQAGRGRSEFRCLRQLYPGRILSHRHHCRRDDQVEEYRHGRRLSDPRGQPADERLHGRRQGNRPDAKFQVAFIGSWFDPPKAKETAFAQIDGGADLLYAERFGVSDAAKEKSVLAIGNVIDTQADYPETVVASALWHFEPTLDKAIEEIKAGSFKAADYGIYSFMKEGGCSLAPLGTFEGKVPAEVMTMVTEKRKGDQGRHRSRSDRRRGARSRARIAGTVFSVARPCVLRSAFRGSADRQG